MLALWAVRETLRAAWALAREPVIFTLQIIAALIILFEEWGWRPLSDALARLARYAPIARLERFIAGLGPYPSLFVFALPTAFLAPLKLLAVYLLASGSYWTATALFVAAKIAATALVARLFILTKPSLMRIEWFARAYEWFVPWEEYFATLIRKSWPWRYGRMVKNRVRQWTSRWASAARATLARWLSAAIAGNGVLRDLFEMLPERWRQRIADAGRKPPPEAAPEPAPRASDRAAPSAKKPL